MGLLKVHNKKQNVTYIYENQAFWDPEKHQSRAKRKLVGKLDPVTGDVVPTGKRGRPKSSGSSIPPVPQYDHNDVEDQLARARKRITDLEKELSETRNKVRKYEAALKSLRGTFCEKSDFISGVING